MSGAGVSTVEAFEPFGSFAQRSIWTNVRFQRREEEITMYAVGSDPKGYAPTRYRRWY